MAKRQGGGSQTGRWGEERAWASIRRGLIILQQLQQGAKSKFQLMKAVQAVLPSAYRQETEKARTRNFERDLANLRMRLGVVIDWQRTTKTYELVDSGAFYQLALSDEGLNGVAFLLETFGSQSGAYDILRPFLQSLEGMLSSEQLRQLAHQDSPLRVNLRRLDSGTIAPSVWEKVRYAVAQRRLLEFDYLSPRHETEEPRRHRVEPYELQFERGHYYLKGYCLRWWNPHGFQGGQRWFSYRLDHMLSDHFEILAKPISMQREQRLLAIKYRVAGRLWRGSMSRHFEEMVVGEPDAEDWVVVTAKTTDLFQAHRTLLAYGELCQVLEPPELVQMMKTAVLGAAKLYDDDN